MSKALRLSEKWFNRGLWLLALVFAGFLIGLGGTVVGDLPQVETATTMDDFMDRGRLDAVRGEIDAARKSEQQTRDALAQARLKLGVAQADVSNARKSFENWIATRSATERAEQDPELIARTRALDALQARERAARGDLEAQEQRLLDTRQAGAAAQRQLQDMQASARDAYQRALRAQELRVFGYRLALTLPLLALAGWLFARKRKSAAWPFVWGFIVFALFAFFVELVPYLPSYGGYVRYLVGIVVTALVGRWAIGALGRYRSRQQQAEAQPEQERRRELSYDTALARLAKSVCPGCERPVELKDGQTDFCPHCGIGLFDRCQRCEARKSAFARYCHACGATAASQAS